MSACYRNFSDYVSVVLLQSRIRSGADNEASIGFAADDQAKMSSIAEVKIFEAHGRMAFEIRHILYGEFPVSLSGRRESCLLRNDIRLVLGQIRVAVAHAHGMCMGTVLVNCQMAAAIGRIKSFSRKRFAKQAAGGYFCLRYGTVLLKVNFFCAGLTTEIGAG